MVCLTREKRQPAAGQFAFRALTFDIRGRGWCFSSLNTIDSEKEFVSSSPSCPCPTSSNLCSRFHRATPRRPRYLRTTGQSPTKKKAAPFWGPPFPKRQSGRTLGGRNRLMAFRGPEHPEGVSRTCRQGEVFQAIAASSLYREEALAEPKW